MAVLTAVDKTVRNRTKKNSLNAKDSNKNNQKWKTNIHMAVSVKNLLDPKAKRVKD
jgi:hypothetical protein